MQQKAVAFPIDAKLMHRARLEFRQAYARLLLDEVTVSDEEIRLSGSKDVLARCASGEANIATPAVLSFVPEWRAQGDSNPCFRRERATS